jgi:hypothetical protein
MESSHPYHAAARDLRCTPPPVTLEPTAVQSGDFG